MRPTSRMFCSSSSPLTRPTGALVFCARSAATTSPADTLYSRSFCACSSTDSSRRSAPSMLTTATPSTARSWSASTSSARREISACDCLVDDSPRFMMGSAAGSHAVQSPARASRAAACSAPRQWRCAPRRPTRSCPCRSRR